jgi:hypothetical protein
MNTFVVTGNWCDDTWVVGIYSSREKAQAALEAEEPVNKNNPSSTYYDIEEYQLDITGKRF